MSARGNVVAVAVAVLMGGFAGKVGAATFTATVPQPPRYAFITNLGSGTISQYTIDATTGVLRPNGYTLCASGGQPICIAVDPANKFAMSGTFGTVAAQNALTAYTIATSGATGGRLTQVDNEVTHAGPNDLAFSIDGTTLYYPNLDSNFLRQFTVNTTTGIMAALGGTISTGTTPETPVVHPTLRVVYVPSFSDGNIAMYSNNNAGNALTETLGARVPIAGPSGSAPGPVSMVVPRNGKWAYVGAYETSSLHVFNINQSSGVLTAHATQPLLLPAGMTRPASLAADNTSNTLYCCNDGSNNVSVFSINQTTGVLTLIQTIAAGGNPARLNMDPSNSFVYCVNRTTNDVTMYSRAATGLLTTLGTVRAMNQPYAMAIAAGTAQTYVPKFAYCTNSGDDSIGQYSINATTGALTALNPRDVDSEGGQPLWAEIEPTGRFLYCLCRNDTGNGGRGIQRFTINQTTGQLTASGNLVATDDSPRRFAIEPSGRFLYLAHDTDQSIWTYSINAGTGALTRITGTAFTISTGNEIWGITVDVTGQFLLVPDRTNNRTSSYAINPVTGGLTFIQDSAAQGVDPYTVRNDPTGRFVYVGNNTSPETATYTLSATGTWGTVGTATAGGTTSIQFDVTPNGKFGYSANFGTNNVGVFTINQGTGALTSAGVQGVGQRPQGLIVDPSGKFLYVPNSGSATISCFTINQTTGALTAIGGGTVAAADGPHTVTIFGVLQ